LETATDKAGQPFVRQVEPHIFEGAMMAVRRVYSSIAYIDFTYVDLENPYVAVTNRFRRRERERDRGRGVAIRYPAITIERR
jgi:hypothetical protein